MSRRVGVTPSVGALTILSRLSMGRYAGALLGLVGACLYFGVTQPGFLSWDNATNIVASNSVVIILGIGATFVLLAGALDLSAASGLTACGMVVGLALEAGQPFTVVFIIAMLFGALLGLMNGLLIAWLNIPFLVATLGTLSIYASLALVLNNGTTINVFTFSGFGPFGDIANAQIGPIPLLMLIDAALLLTAGAVLRYTAFGRAIFAVGSNPDAARLAGIRVGAVLVSVFVVAGVSVALASVVAVGRLAASAPAADPTLLLTTLAAVIIGGTSYKGGEGGVLGTLIGALFLGVVQNGLTLSDIPAYWQGAVSGTILIAAVGIAVLRDRVRRLRSARAAAHETQPNHQPVDVVSTSPEENKYA